MTRLRICDNGPLLLADGRLAVLENGERVTYPKLFETGSNEWVTETEWRAVPIVEDEDDEQQDGN